MGLPGRLVASAHVIRAINTWERRRGEVPDPCGLHPAGLGELGVVDRIAAQRADMATQCGRLWSSDFACLRPGLCWWEHPGGSGSDRARAPAIRALARSGTASLSQRGEARSESRHRCITAGRIREFRVHVHSCVARASQVPFSDSRPRTSTAMEGSPSGPIAGQQPLAKEPSSYDGWSEAPSVTSGPLIR